MIQVAILILLFSTLSYHVQANKCNAQDQLGKLQQCSYQSVASSLICQCQFDILGYCVTPSFPCSKTYLSWLYDDSQNRSEYNIWSTVVATFWNSMLNSTSIPANYSELTNNLDFAGMNNTLRKAWTQGFYMFQAISPELGSLNKTVTIELLDSSLKTISPQVANQSSSEMLWQSATALYNNLTAKNWTVSGFQELISLRLQFQLPCHDCSEYYGPSAIANNTKECSPCPQGCRRCSQNNTLCINCINGYLLNSSNICQIQTRLCSTNTQENKKFHQCRFVKIQKSFICSCQFDILGLCIYPHFPCQNSNISYIYDDSQNRSEYNIWSTVVATFWNSMLDSTSIPATYSELTNNLDFAGMNNTLRKAWTQGFYMFQAISPELGSLNKKATIELLDSSLKTISPQVANQSSSEALWQSATALYNNLTAKNWTVSGFQELISLRLQFQLPCHDCSEYYGPSAIANNTKECSPCPQGCRRCSQNNTLCQQCSDGYIFDGKKQCKTICPKQIQYSSCTSCAYLYLNNYECKSCLLNYGLSYSSSLNTYICSECPKRCNSCSTNSTICTSCTEGFTLNLQHNKCMKSKKIDCKYKINTPYKQFVAQKKHLTFIQLLAAILKLESQDITILKMYEGSTVIQAIVSATQSQVSQVFQNLKTAKIPGFQVQSSQFDFEGDKFECNPYSCFSSNNQSTVAQTVVFIVFISIAGVMIFLLFLVCVIRYTRSKEQKQNSKENRFQSTINLKTDQIQKI